MSYQIKQLQGYLANAEPGEVQNAARVNSDLGLPAAQTEHAKMIWVGQENTWEAEFAKEYTARVQNLTYKEFYFCREGENSATDVKRKCVCNLKNE